jgi:hypothetical protein
MNSKLSTVVFAQGWLDGQIENVVKSATMKQNEDPTPFLIATQVQEQWTLVSNALDELIRENQDMERRLAVVRSALQ